MASIEIPRTTGEKLPEFEPETHESKEFLHPGKILSLFELTDEEKNLLSQRIKEANGLVRIFVHPYYQKYKVARGYVPPRPIEDEPEEKTKKETLNRAILKMAKLTPEKTPPIFFFEEFERVNEFKKKVEGVLRNEFYIVPTEPSEPKPKIDSEDLVDSWHTLSNKLHELEVKKILIGGMYFEVNYERPRPEGDDSPLWQCVGVTIDNLRKDFEIEVSNLTLMHGRKEYLQYKQQMDVDPSA